LINILIAEDDPVSAAVLEKIVSLQPENKVTVASDGVTAWELLDDPGRSFDIVFLDLEMPKLNGFEVLERIRTSSLLKSLQIVLCTASNDRETVVKAVALGARHYLVKPCTEESVTAKLQQLRQLRNT
jgi:two-component system chemotaxis response regulator CheY